LAVNARKEDTLLSTLTNLKQATNWSAVLTQVQGVSPDTLKKAPFAEVNQWAQGENAKILGQKEARKKALDSQLAALMVTLNAAPPSWLKQLAPAAAKRYESDTMPDATRDYYTKQADDLEKKYKNEGLLDSDKRKDYLKTVRERINNWG
jgi:hypothetical protein